MKHGTRALGLLLLASCVLPARGEVRVTPVANISILGGQYWVSQAAPDSFGGNLDVFFSPVINFSRDTALLPLYMGSYSGTKDVRELVGGGTLTRELQDHSLALKFVNRLTPSFKLKTRVGYKIEYLKETSDETWGGGLFDSQKMIAGVEGEKAFGDGAARAGLDYYTMRYPNYRALVTQSEFETSLDTTTYSEISSQAGDNPLDYAAIALFIERTRAFSPRLSGLLHYDLSLKNFKDQKTVQQTGEFSGTLRQDYAHYLTLGITYVTPRLSAGLADTFQYYDSNQNSFDVSTSGFVQDYYDFTENAFLPNLTLSLGPLDAPVKLSLYWNLAFRRYAERPAQNADATLRGQKISQVTNTTGVVVTWPLAGTLSAKLAANYRDSSSNMRFEKNYKYNYYTFNYFLGVNWEL